MITAISVIGVAAGVASLIIALSITNGFRQDLQNRLLGASAHVQLMRVAGDGIRDWPAVLAKLEKQPHVVSAAPALYEQVLISRGAQAQGANLKGVVPEYERKVSDMLSFVKIGSADPLRQQPEPAQPEPSVQRPAPYPTAYPPIVLGKDLADKLNASAGSIVLVTSPQGELTPFGIVPKYMHFKVVGLMQAGFYDYDISWALARLADAQRLFGLGDVVSVIEFKVDDIYRVEQIGHELEEVAGPGFMATNWMEQNRELFRALRLEQAVTFITIGLIVFVAALNILIALIMMVMEKTRDIAVLMSLGARKRQVQRIFIAQGVLIGISGTVIGLIAGYVLAWSAGHYKLISLSAAVYSVDYVPFAPRAIHGVLVGLLAIGVSFVATLYPSYSAARVFPAEALRYE